MWWVCAGREGGRKGRDRRHGREKVRWGYQRNDFLDLATVSSN
jgi:hypothetical protein